MENTSPRINTNKVLIKPIVEESMSAVVLTNTKNTRPVKGEIIGMGKAEKETEYKIGDIVLFGEYSGTEVYLKPKEKLILLGLEDIYLAL